MKTVIATGILLGCAPVAIAGPYANVESNTAWYGNDYEGVVTEAHVGFEDVIGENGSYYIQAGPAFVAVDGKDTESEFSGKVGATYEVAENVEVYGEYSFVTGDELGSGVKTGVTYRF